MRAFQAALELGAGGIELDVHSAADGTIVVHHDPAVSGRLISGMTARDVAALRLENGDPVPLLEDVLATVSSAAILYVEVKTLDPRWDERLIRLVTGGATECHIHAFDHRIIKRLHDRYPAISYGVLSSSYLVDSASQLRRAGAVELWQEQHLIDRSLVEEMHAIGAGIIVWTVNEEQRMTALAELGVDGICTNHPDIAGSLIQ